MHEQIPAHIKKYICIKKTRCHCVRPDAFRAPNLDQKKSASKKYHSSSCSCSRGSRGSSSSSSSTNNSNSNSISNHSCSRSSGSSNSNSNHSSSRSSTSKSSSSSSSSSSSNVSTWLVAWYSIVAKKSSLFSSMLFGGGLYCGKFFSIFIIFCWFMFLIVPNYFFEFIFKWINLKLFLCFSFFWN